MRIGVPTEIKDNEFRVAITPAGVHALTRRGHEVTVQAGAGAGSGIDDGEYAAAGAAIGDDVEALGRLDASSGWGKDRWDEVLGRYWDEYDWIGTDTSARAVSLAPLDESPDETALAAAGVSERLREALETSGRQVWLATQVLEDPDGDHDWRLTALVDLAECDRDKRAVIHLLSVGPQG